MKAKFEFNLEDRGDKQAYDFIIHNTEKLDLLKKVYSGLRGFSIQANKNDSNTILFKQLLDDLRSVVESGPTSISLKNNLVKE